MKKYKNFPIHKLDFDHITYKEFITFKHVKLWPGDENQICRLSHDFHKKTNGNYKHGNILYTNLKRVINAIDPKILKTYIRLSHHKSQGITPDEFFFIERDDQLRNELIAIIQEKVVQLKKELFNTNSMPEMIEQSLSQSPLYLIDCLLMIVTISAIRRPIGRYIGAEVITLEQQNNTIQVCYKTAHKANTQNALYNTKYSLEHFYQIENSGLKIDIMTNASADKDIFHISLFGVLWPCFKFNISISNQKQWNNFLHENKINHSLSFKDQLKQTFNLDVFDNRMPSLIHLITIQNIRNVISENTIISGNNLDITLNQSHKKRKNREDNLEDSEKPLTQARKTSEITFFSQNNNISLFNSNNRNGTNHKSKSGASKKSEYWADVALRQFTREGEEYDHELYKLLCG